MQLVTIDGDGKRILDYLGPIISAQASSSHKFKESMIKSIYEFVLTEQERINEETIPS